MRKKLLLCLSLILGTMPLLADRTPVTITFKKKKTGGVGETIGRAPMNLPIEVTCDDATGILTVSAPEDMEGRVYVYNVDGTLEGSSQTLNATFTLTFSGMHVIAIEGDSWIGEGRIIL